MDANAQRSFAEWDAFTSCDLIEKVAGCLSGPCRRSGSSFGTAEEMQQRCKDRGIQKRLRGVFLLLLQILDLSDGPTRNRLRCCGVHMNSLISSFVANHSTIAHARCRKQWEALLEVVVIVCQRPDAQGVQSSKIILPCKESPAAVGLLESSGIFANAGSAVAAILATPKVEPGTEVNFLSTRGDQGYTLRLSKTTRPPHWYCSCPSWKFQRIHPLDRVCKHMQGLVLENDLLVRR